MSGVYIKGLGMPKDGEHPYWVVIHSDGIVEYNENKGQGWQTSEVVPVPPHGRLVDADALEKVMVEGIAPSERGGGFQHPYDILRALVAAPTIIPASEDTQKDGGQDDG